MTSVTPIFARTRHVYDSYQDFWRLVELSGFETCYVDEIDLQAPRTYITTPMNGDFWGWAKADPATYNHRKARIIWWNLERPDDHPPGHTLSVTAIADAAEPWVDAIWVSDRFYATLDPRFKHVVLGSHRGLAEAPEAPLQFDWTHQSYAYGRRMDVYHMLRAARLKEGPNGWGVPRSETLRASRCIINVHQHEPPALIAEPLRFAVAAAHSMLLISEHCADPWPLVPGTDFIMRDVNKIAPLVLQHYKEFPQKDWALGSNLFTRLCIEWSFRRGVEEALGVPT